MSDLNLTEAVLQIADSLRISAACIDRPLAERIADAVERQVRERIAAEIEALVLATEWEGIQTAEEMRAEAAHIARGGAA